METIVISVGGSLIVPSDIDTDFLKELRALLETESTKRFIIIAGGGRTGRRYQDAAATVHGLDKEDLDWMSIHATRLNGHLLRTVLKDIAHPVMITNPDEILDAPKNARIIIAAGYRPGASTDLRAIQIAERVVSTKVINLSNIDYVYTADPRTNEEATPIKDITWNEFRKLIPSEWDPGLSSPFDPIAAKEAEVKNIEGACINGNKLGEIKKYLNSEEFIGTRIHN